MIKYKIKRKIVNWEKMESVTSHDLYPPPSPCHKLSHFLRPPPPLERDILYGRPLSMREHVRHVCRSSFYQLRQLRVVRGSLTFEASIQLVHAFINSRLDYCSSLLAGVSDQLIGQLQSFLQTAARLVLQKKKYDHISDDIRNKLHWLPIRQRISFKLC